MVKFEVAVILFDNKSDFNHWRFCVIQTESAIATVHSMAVMNLYSYTN